MKLFKKILAFAVVLTGVVAGLGIAALPLASYAAETPTKWYLTYDEGTSRWYGSSDGVNWSDDSLSSFKAGDTLIINADNQNQGAQYIVWCPAAIGELAIINKANVVVNASYVDHFYVVGNATGVVNGNVNKAEAYPTGVLQINGDVNEFVANYEDGKDTAFAVTGTVGKANVKWTGNVLANTTTIYNVAKGKLIPDQYSKHVVLEDGKDCSTDPAAQTYPASGSASAASTEAKAEEKQLDKVPKTGFLNVLPESLLFFALAAVFAVGAVCYRKKLGR